MVKIRCRKETGRLYLDFFIQGVRFREQTLLLDTKENQKTLEKFAKTIEAKLTLGEFYYEDFFPSSKRNIAKAAELGLSRVEIEPVEGEASDEAISSKLPTSRQGKRRLETPFFNDFAEQFFKEKQIECQRQLKTDPLLLKTPNEK